MNRKKKDKPGRRADFRTSPFKALKGFSAAGKASPAKAAAPPSSGPTEDDDTLFRRATEGARPLHAPGSPKAAGVSAQAVQRGEARQPDDQLFLEAMGAMGTGFRSGRRDAEEADAMQEQEAGGGRSPSSRMRQLKRGTLRIGAELDLHGFFKDEAIRRLEHFLLSSAGRGFEAVLVITGKGTNSPEGPVLPGAVAAWLRGPGLRYAVEFHPAPRERGGSGAFVVFLRRR